MNARYHEGEMCASYAPHRLAEERDESATGKLVEGDVRLQTQRVFDNLEAVLASAGLRMHDVAKCTVYLTDMDDFAAMNEVYAQRFTPPFPARSTVAVAGLLLGARVEIELIAKRP
jgi:2-iminobutanoate/2-iminopropanoate deaminase